MKRRLALQLAALPPAQRQQLLAELPAEKRQQLLQLIGEIEPIVAGKLSLFEHIMAEADLLARAQTTCDEAQLAALLGSGNAALKRQLMDVFARKQSGLITEHVQGIVASYLQERSGQLPAASAPRPPRRWWSR
jgi:hypothetical protein